MATRPVELQSLPFELLELIFEHLELGTLTNLMRCCQRFNAILEPRIWSSKGTADRALHWATKTDRVDVIAKALEYGADVTSSKSASVWYSDVTMYVRQAIYNTDVALAHDSLKAYEYLILRGALPSRQGTKKERRAFHKNAGRSIETLNLLRSLKVPIPNESQLQCDVLCRAILKSEDVSVLDSWIREYDVNVNQIHVSMDAKKLTPLSAALIAGRTDHFEMLLKHGALIDGITLPDSTHLKLQGYDFIPIITAVSMIQQNGLDSVKLCLAHGASLSCEIPFWGPYRDGGSHSGWSEQPWPASPLRKYLSDIKSWRTSAHRVSPLEVIKFFLNNGASLEELAGTKVTQWKSHPISTSVHCTPNYTRFMRHPPPAVRSMLGQFHEEERKEPFFLEVLEFLLENGLTWDGFSRDVVEHLCTSQHQLRNPSATVRSLLKVVLKFEEKIWLDETLTQVLLQCVQNHHDIIWTADPRFANRDKAVCKDPRFLLYKDNRRTESGPSFANRARLIIDCFLEAGADINYGNDGERWPLLEEAFTWQPSVWVRSTKVEHGLSGLKQTYAKCQAPKAHDADILEVFVSRGADPKIPLVESRAFERLMKTVGQQPVLAEGGTAALERIANVLVPARIDYLANMSSYQNVSTVTDELSSLSEHWLPKALDISSSQMLSPSAAV